jgi:hypothetical protein
MRIDLYTKTVLTVIALLLSVIALKPIFQPAPAMAQGKFTGVEFASSSGRLFFFDSRTGHIWTYFHENGSGGENFTLTELGKPLTQ